MAEPYVGQITAFAFPFTPKSWAACDGSTLPVNQYGALFSLFGAAFGGNGSSTFGLPDLRNASPCGTGTGPGLTSRGLGQGFGTATVTLDLTTIPPHVHTAQSIPFSRSGDPSGTPTTLSGLSMAGGSDIYRDGAPDIVMSGGAISPSGGGTAHNNLQPCIGVNYCIAVLGQYPSFD